MKICMAIFSLLQILTHVQAADGVCDEPNDCITKTIVDVGGEFAVEYGVSPLLVAALKKSSLAEPLEGDGPFTVFAPSETALKFLDLNALLKDLGAAQNILLNHVVSGKFMASDMIPGQTYQTAGGNILTIMSGNNDSSVMVNNVIIERADVVASNGVIHIINGVLDFGPTENIIEFAAAADNFSTLVAAVKAAGLVDVLSGEGPMTLLAPNNAAFAKVENFDALMADAGALKELLLNHIVGELVTSEMIEPSSWSSLGSSFVTLGGKTITVTLDENQPSMVNSANIGLYDLMVKNGVIHEIDTVLTFQEDKEMSSVDEVVNETSAEDSLEEAKSASENKTDTPADNNSAAFAKAFNVAFICVVSLFFAL